MIVQLRGTSGSGKSTIVRSVMERYTGKEPLFIDGRRQPIGYRLHGKTEKPLHLVGHYESVCGGCDTISMPGMMDYMYNLITDADDRGEDVLYEGLIIESDVKRCITLKPRGLLVIGLTTPVDVCLDSIRLRRLARGNEKPLNEANTRDRVPQIQIRMKKLQQAGVDARWLSREDALKTVIEVLGL